MTQMDSTVAAMEEMSPQDEEGKPRRLALVASKGGLDEVYPILIMASTAGALGWEVGIFCTFYGLDMVNTKRMKRMKVAAVGNAASPPPVGEVRVPTILGILPGMNSVATWMMKNWMKSSKIPTYDDLFETCVESGVEFYACATTMGVMNVKQEEIMEGVSCLGATAFLDFASEADLALFV